MICDVITIFPQMFEGPMSASILGLARERGLLEVRVHDLRDWAHDRHRTTDDYPYGGGAGLVMKPEPIFEALDAVQELEDEPGFVIFMTPAGRPLTQTIVSELAEKERLIFVCGRYEGFDERVMTCADLQLSIGDYVLTGGELPAMVTIDAVARLVPGVLGDEESSADDSFSSGLLEYPQYTRPAHYRGMSVPEVLRSGNHALIAAWRREQALRRTARTRPELLGDLDLSSTEFDIVQTELDKHSEHAKRSERADE
ncbi:MAG: tRNA (guanosine(37)-N1)-methyltransferase TrmD [Coriobacteriia bacterium]